MSDAAKLCRERCRRGVGAAMPGARGDASPEMSGRAKKDGAGEFLPPAGGALFDADDERVASGAGDEMLSSDATVRIGGGRPPTAALAEVAAVTTVASAPGALPDRAGPRLDNRELEPKERTRMTLALCWAEPLSTSAYPPSSESPKEPKEAGEAIVIGGGIAKAGARGGEAPIAKFIVALLEAAAGLPPPFAAPPPAPPWSTSHESARTIWRRRWARGERRCAGEPTWIGRHWPIGTACSRSADSVRSGVGCSAAVGLLGDGAVRIFLVGFR